MKKRGSAVRHASSASFGRYLVESLVGEGSMGRVYRAYDPLAKRRVAIKTPKDDLLEGPEAEEYVARFRREAQAAAALAHPHIVTLFDVGEDYFVMELLEGVTLQTVLAERGRLDLPEVLRILEPIAGAVDFAHQKGVIHRDIKPANIFVLGDGRPKMMDFGVAHFVSASLGTTGQIMGSPAYMAPEQITGGQATVRTDLFSLAVVAYQMLTGRRPFEGDDISEVVYRVVHADPAPPSAWAPGLPPAHDDVFRRALAKDPGERFPSATGLLAALDRRRAVRVSPETPDGDIETHDLAVEFDDEAGAPAGAPPLVETPAAGRGARVWALAAAVAAVVGLGAVGLRSGRVPLFRKPVAAISVMTEPPNAVVRVDGLRVGRAPVTQDGLAPGPHTVQVGLDGFTAAELSLQLQGDEMPVPLRFALQPTGAELQILSEPPGATVRLDGKIVGLTPLESVPTLPGTHELTVEQTGFRPWAQTVQVTAGDRIPLNARMEPARPTSAASAQLRRMGWVRPGDVAALGPGITPPQKVSGEAAAYPAGAKRLKLEGAVAVALTVTETGVPADVRVVQSGGELLDAAMIAAVRTWRYAPATKNGVKVRVRIQADQKFTYKK